MNYILPVVLAFCQKDIHIALSNIEWQLELGCRGDHLVLSYDAATNKRSVDAVEELARKIYNGVSHFRYPSPPPHYWPPNQAFQETARHMATQNKSWYWSEPDCVPLTLDWLEVLSRRYHQFGKPFFCPLVSDLGHYNGTGVYPHNTPELISHAMRDTHTAWDVAARHQMTGKTADANATLYHTWSMHSGKFHPSIGGEHPRFYDLEQLRQIPPSCVLFHRCKDDSLIEMLRQIRKKT